MTQAIPSACAVTASRVEDRAQVRDAAVDDGDAGKADGYRHAGVWSTRPDDRLGLRHDLPRRTVVDAQRGRRDPVEPDPLQPLPPRLRETVPGLGAVADDGEAPGRAPQQQHLPLGVGQFLRLVHDDVRERPGEPVRVGGGQLGLVQQADLRRLSPRSIRTRPSPSSPSAPESAAAPDQVVDDQPCARAGRRRRPRADARRAASGSPSRRRAASRSGAGRHRPGLGVRARRSLVRRRGRARERTAAGRGHDHRSRPVGRASSGEARSNAVRSSRFLPQAPCAPARAGASPSASPSCPSTRIVSSSSHTWSRASRCARPGSAASNAAAQSSGPSRTSGPRAC